MFLELSQKHRPAPVPNLVLRLPKLLLSVLPTDKYTESTSDDEYEYVNCMEFDWKLNKHSNTTPLVAYVKSFGLPS